MAKNDYYSIDAQAKISPKTGNTYFVWVGNTYAIKALFVALRNNDIEKGVNPPRAIFTGNAWVTAFDERMNAQIKQYFEDNVALGNPSPKQVALWNDLASRGYCTPMSEDGTVTVRNGDETATFKYVARTCSEALNDLIAASRVEEPTDTSRERPSNSYNGFSNVPTLDDLGFAAPAASKQVAKASK